MALQAAVGPLLTYVVKPLAISQAKKLVDEFFDPATAKVLKKMMGEEANLAATLEDISTSLEQVKALVKETSWMAAWGNTHTQLSKLGSLLAEHEYQRDKFLEAQKKLAGKENSRAIQTEFEEAVAAYYTSCIKCLGASGLAAKSRNLVSELVTPLPQAKNKSLLEYSAELLNREHTEVFTYANAIDNILEYPFKYLINAISAFDEARQFQQAAKEVEYEGKPKFTLDNAFKLESPEGKKLLKKYKDIVGDAHEMKVRLEELAKSKDAVGVRSLRWPLAQRADYDCYLTACVDGTPHSASNAIEERKVPAGNGVPIGSYELGITENRLRHGFPQVFAFRAAKGSTRFQIEEINDKHELIGGTSGLVDSAFSKLSKLGSRTEVSYELEDDANRARLVGKRISKFNWLDLYPPSLFTGGGVIRTVRTFVFTHDRDSQSWKIEKESENGKTYILLRHVASGKFLGAMRLNRVYLTMDKTQSRWELVMTEKGEAVEGGNPADKLGFILRSAHDERHALNCDFSRVDAESGIKDTAKGQRLQLFTWS